MRTLLALLFAALFAASLSAADAKTVNEGASVVIVVKSDGTEPKTYQWRLNGVDVPAAKNPTLPIPVVSKAHEGAYTCKISNSAGSILSDVAALTVIPVLPPPVPPPPVLPPTTGEATIIVK
jgi:hypothetical protein